ncbi:MAG: Ig-like domain-containing domain [Bacteroidales bacterium]
MKMYNMYQSRKIIRLAILLFLAIILYRCAKIGTISGGPKDTAPPKMIGSNPALYAKNFNGQRIRIDFDEYIVLKDLDKEFNVSPPMRKQPKIWVKDKSVIIQYNDSLHANTTYTFSFGNSIVDNNEGNVLENFEFVVSTGDTIDSLGIFGTVVDAYRMKPPTEKTLVALYDNLADSAPLKMRPRYTARVSKDGFYHIHHVKAGKYRLFAFGDKNYNYQYDPYNETFAFIDSVIELTPQNIARHATLWLMDTLPKSDTTHHVVMDSTRLKNLKNALHADLRLFTEINSQQYIRGYYRPLRELLTLKFALPIAIDSVQIQPIYLHHPHSWYKTEILQAHSDSILLWLTDTSLSRIDTLRMRVTYPSMNKQNVDTLMFRYFDSEAKHKENKMAITFSAANTIAPNQVLSLETQYPIEQYFTDSIQILEAQDTLWTPAKFTLQPDSFSTRKFYLKKLWESEKKYRLIVLPSAFVNIYGKTCDTLRASFMIQRAESFGTLYIQPLNFFYPCVVQLLQKDAVMYEQYITHEQKIKWKYLQPGEYQLRTIWDIDGNKTFTPGNYFSRRQPERVEVYPETVKIRANWEIEIYWPIKP